MHTQTRLDGLERPSYWVGLLDSIALYFVPHPPLPWRDS